MNEVQQQFVAKLKEAEKEEFKLISTKGKPLKSSQIDLQLFLIASNDDLFSLDKERARRLSKDDKTKRHKDSKAKKGKDEVGSRSLSTHEVTWPLSITLTQ